MSSAVTRLARRVRTLLGSTVEHDLSRFRARLAAIGALEPELVSLDETGLRNRAACARVRARDGEDLDALVVEVFALVREAARRTIGQRPFDEQLLAGLAMHGGAIAEMQTGEGKTLAAVAPAALQALAGAGAHVLTFNDYLARRDAVWMGPIYRLLGLSVGHVQQGMSADQRRAAYAGDVTYLTAAEAGFDLLRDGLCLEPENTVHRPLNFALVDEADSILIDEARIPLVIAGNVDEPGRSAFAMARLAHHLRPGLDFATDEHAHNVFLTDAGAARAEAMLRCGSLYDPENLALLADLRNALHAEHLLRRDVDYIVRSGRVELVDDFTGRVADRRQWPDGLQAALEAKESLVLGAEGRILGAITMQHFLRLYARLCGMTATAQPAAQELASFYGLEVVVVPTNKPCVRIDDDDLVFTHCEAKQQALIDEIAHTHASGRPVLVGTASVAESERLANDLRYAGIACAVLNAKNDEAEAAIVANAGAIGAVTISTNMAGRGTDIRLGGAAEHDRATVVSLGGLYVIGTNRHESLRVDQQLRGRAGRQGDPGSSRFFVSLEDPLIVRYGVRELIPPESWPAQQAAPLADPVFGREIRWAQRFIEGESSGIRKRLWEYSALQETHRRWMQEWRLDVLSGAAPLGLLAQHRPERVAELQVTVGDEVLQNVERRLTLLAIDRCWSEHLANLRWLRDGIHVVNFVGKDPLAEFYREAGAAFEEIEAHVEEQTVAMFDTLSISEAGVDWAAAGLLGPSSTWTYQINEHPFGVNPMQVLAHRPGVATLAIPLLAPLIILWGFLVRHLRRTKDRSAQHNPGLPDTV